MADDDLTDLQADPGARLPEAHRARPELSWQSGTEVEHRVLSAAAVIGSAPGVDVTLNDPAVSRLHAELDLRDDGVWVRDLGSRNGTFVEGVRVIEARLHDGCHMRVGSTAITVRYERKAAPLELWPFDRFGPLVGRSARMRELFARIAKVAVTDTTVLVRGETGTGKELIAEAIHQASDRADKPFVVVDCGSLPENLIESELFGHTRGAFTGAVSARAGAIEQAEGGTVFFDEIGELPLAVQPKLLRLIESRTVRRIGDAAHKSVNVRFVSATHRDLREMVNRGAFREDLFFRLAVVPLTVPPLRERLGDIPLLVQHFLAGDAAATIDDEALAKLGERPWLGNVRELRNVLDRVRALGAREGLEMSHEAPVPVPGDLPGVEIDRPFKEVRDGWMSHLEREYVQKALVRHGGNVSAVAQAAGLDRSYVHRLIRKHDLGS